MTRSEPKSRFLPLVILLSSQALSLVIALLGLMSATETKIQWTSYLAKLKIFYQENIGAFFYKPFFEIKNWLEMEFDWDLSWLPSWAPDYLPIASTFSIGLFLGYCHVYRTNLFMLSWKYLQEVWTQWYKHDLGDSIGALIQPFILLPIIVLIAPVFFIAIPVLYVALICVVLFIYTLFAYFALKIFITYCLPPVLLFYLVVFIRRDTDWAQAVLGFTGEIRVEWRRGISDGASRSREWFIRELPKHYQSVKNTLNDRESEFHSVKNKLITIFLIQHAVALFIGMLFLTLVAINYMLL